MALTEEEKRKFFGDRAVNSGYTPFNLTPAKPKVTDETKSDFIDDIQREVGNRVRGVGSAVRDIGLESLGRWVQGAGDNVVRANEADIQRLQDIPNKKGQLVSEGLTGAVASGLMMSHPVARGLEALSMYGNIRQEQRDNKDESIPRALAATAGSYALDRYFGVGKLGADLAKQGISELARKEGTDLLKHVGKQFGKGAIGEAVTEFPQGYIEDFGGSTDLDKLTSLDTFNKNLTGSALGAVGGGGVRGGLSAAAGTYVDPELQRLRDEENAARDAELEAEAIAAQQAEMVRQEQEFYDQLQRDKEEADAFVGKFKPLFDMDREVKFSEFSDIYDQADKLEQAQSKEKLKTAQAEWKKHIDANPDNAMPFNEFEADFKARNGLNKKKRADYENQKLADFQQYRQMRMSMRNSANETEQTNTKDSVDPRQMSLNLQFPNPNDEAINSAGVEGYDGAGSPITLSNEVDSPYQYSGLTIQSPSGNARGYEMMSHQTGADPQFTGRTKTKQESAAAQARADIQAEEAQLLPTDTTEETKLTRDEQKVKDRVDVIKATADTDTEQAPKLTIKPNRVKNSSKQAFRDSVWQRVVEAGLTDMEASPILKMLNSGKVKQASEKVSQLVADKKAEVNTNRDLKNLLAAIAGSKNEQDVVKYAEEFRQRVLNMFTDSKRAALERYMGLNSERMTQSEIAKELGVTRANVKQTLTEINTKLQDVANSIGVTPDQVQSVFDRAIGMRDKIEKREDSELQKQLDSGELTTASTEEVSQVDDYNNEQYGTGTSDDAGMVSLKTVFGSDGGKVDLGQGLIEQTGIGSQAKVGGTNVQYEEVTDADGNVEVKSKVKDDIKSENSIWDQLRAKHNADPKNKDNQAPAFSELGPNLREMFMEAEASGAKTSVNEDIYDDVTDIYDGLDQNLDLDTDQETMYDPNENIDLDAERERGYKEHKAEQKKAKGVDEAPKKGRPNAEHKLFFKSIVDSFNGKYATKGADGKYKYTTDSKGKRQVVSGEKWNRSEAPISNGTGQRAVELRNSLLRTFAAGNVKNFDSRVTVLDSAADLPAAKQLEFGVTKDTQGVYDHKTGRAYLFANKIEKGNELAVALHEVGIHGAAQNTIIDGHRTISEKLHARIVDWAKNNKGLEGDIAREAIERANEAEKNNPDKANVLPQEYVAYFVEAAVNRGIDPSTIKEPRTTLQRFLKSIYDNFVQAMRKLVGYDAKLSAQDVVDISFFLAKNEVDNVTRAEAAARYDANDGRGTSTNASRNGNLGNQNGSNTGNTTRRNSPPPADNWRITDDQQGTDLAGKIVQRAKAAGRKLHQLFNEDILRFGKLNMMTVHQLAQTYKNMPALKKFSDIIGMMSSEVHNSAQDFAKLHERLIRLEDNDKQNLYRAMSSSTIAGAHIDLPLLDPANAHLDDKAKAEWIKSRPLWNKLTPEAKQLYTDYKNQFEKSYTELRDMIKQTAVDMGVKPPKLPTIKGPYFPIMRFGDYVSVYKSQTYKDAENAGKSTDALKGDPAHYRVEFFDNKLDAQDRLKEWGVGGEPKVRAESEFAMHGMNSAFVQAIEKKLEANGVDRDAIQHVKQIYMDALPDANILKRTMKRIGVYNSNTHEMGRSLAQASMSMAFHKSRIMHGKDLTNTLQELRTDGSNPTQDVLRVMQKHYALIMRAPDKQNGIDKAMGFSTSLAYYKHLAMSPAFAMVNATQVPLVTVPYLTKEHGYMKSAKTAFKAMGIGADVVRQMLSTQGWRYVADFTDPQLNLSDEHRAILKKMADLGQIDINMLHDLRSQAEGNDVGSTNAVVDTAMRIMAWVPQQVETANRIATTIAAYDLIKTKESDPQKIADYVKEVVANTQVDYSDANAAIYMKQGSFKGNKLIMQFRKFPQQMAYNAISNAYIMLKPAINKWNKENTTAEEKEEAKKATAFLVSLHVNLSLAAGVTGTPLVGLAMMLGDIGSVLGEDDDEYDTEEVVRRVAIDMFGKTGARIILDGPTAQLGAPLTTRLGMGTIFNPVPFAEAGADFKETFDNFLLNGLAPAVGAIGSFANGVQHLMDGDVTKGMQGIAPKGAADFFKAMELAEYGVQTKTGKARIRPQDVDAVDIGLQGLGITPTIKSEYYRKSNIKYRRDKDISNVRQKLIKAAIKDGKPHMTDDIREFNKRHKIDGIKITRADLFRMLREARKEQRKSVGGVPYDRKDKWTKEHLDW